MSHHAYGAATGDMRADKFRCIIALELSHILIGSWQPTISMLWTKDHTLFNKLSKTKIG